LKFRDNGFPDPGFEIFLIQGLKFRDNRSEGSEVQGWGFRDEGLGVRV
jgi:hypothetical protein